MIESIEKLRELAADMNTTEIIDHLDVVGKFMFHADWLDSWHKAFDAACDEIEREIAERYMELPLDAAGAPIHVGDKMQYHGGEPFTVCAVAPGVIHTWVEVKLGERMTTYDYVPDQCMRYKPRTVEDVLEDFAHNYNSIGGKPDEDELWDKLLADTSAELREMMGRDDG